MHRRPDWTSLVVLSGTFTLVTGLFALLMGSSGGRAFEAPADRSELSFAADQVYDSLASRGTETGAPALDRPNPQPIPEALSRHGHYPGSVQIRGTGSSPSIAFKVRPLGEQLL